ncbi:hypothetical protein EDX97_07805 [Absicoccus porci]|uniref:DNA-binding protein n=1 Tax=Absicoccus porci TaxID=2486576 RepID=A0A3N0I0W2_9FIRM|nr:hypothetical protein [Absicoccus porci]RNM30675.1 hypothetical protein EDX97_07805 [Absicoccus porci]
MRITVMEASDLLDVSPDFLRIALQQEKLPIGIAIKIRGSTRFKYFINPADLAKYMHISLKELEKRKERLHRFDGRSAQLDM